MCTKCKLINHRDSFLERLKQFCQCYLSWQSVPFCKVLGKKENLYNTHLIMGNLKACPDEHVEESVIG